MKIQNFDEKYINVDNIDMIFLHPKHISITTGSLSFLISKSENNLLKIESLKFFKVIDKFINLANVRCFEIFGENLKFHFANGNETSINSCFKSNLLKYIAEH